MSANDTYPWTLRLSHQGYSSICVERRGRWFRFDPMEAPEPDQVSILTWTELERATGVQRALKDGQSPQVVAVPAICDWLAAQGGTRCGQDGEIDGVRVELLEYEPIPYATPSEAVLKARAALRSPLMAASRLRNRVGLPDARPVAVQLGFPNGKRLVHLNCALHQGTPADWLEQAVSRFRGADWLLVGVDYGEDSAVVERLPAFEPGVVLITDLINDARSGIGLPVNILTPVVDQLKDLGVNAHPFVSGAGYRFEA